MTAFPPFAFSGSRFQVSRRGFIRGAAAAAAALPAAPLWADASSGAGDVAAIGLSGKQVTLTAADIKDLRAAYQWSAAARAGRRLRPGTPRLERCVRPASRADRTSCQHRGRGEGGELRSLARLADVGERRRPQYLGAVHLRWRDDDRRGSNEGPASRQGGAHRQGTGRRTARRARCQDTGSGPGDAARYRVGYRHRGPHAGRRPGAAAARTSACHATTCVRTRS